MTVFSCLHCFHVLLHKILNLNVFICCWLHIFFFLFCILNNLVLVSLLLVLSSPSALLGRVGAH